MTFEQVQNQVLKLLNQYSVAGALVAPAYNNQQDYLNRVASLANDAVMEIATTSRKISATLDLASLPSEDMGDWVRYELPEDFYQFKTGDTLLTTDDGRLLHTNRYTIAGKNCLLVPKCEIEEGSSYTITYYRYPKLLSEKPAPTDELDNVPETHYAVPFYVAAFLVIHDDNFLFASFYNKFEDKLAKMGSGLSVEVRPVEDQYSFTAGE